MWSTNLHVKICRWGGGGKEKEPIKQNEKKKFLKFEIFYVNHPPTRHTKYKRIDFAPCNKPIMPNKLLLYQFGATSKTDSLSAYALIARNISRVNCPKLAEIAIFKPP